MAGSPVHVHPQNLPSRRAAIQAGAIGLLGLGMNHIAALKSLAAPGNTAAARTPRAKAVIYIFLSGGLAQHETFDMKPDALDVRGEFSPIRTKTPGIHICEHLPRLAARSQKWALLRSLTHPYNEHSNGHTVMLTGQTPMPPGYDPSKPKPTDWPSMAAIANELVESRNNLPPAVVLPDKIVHNTGRTLPGQFGGIMGARRDPWFIEASPYHPQSYGAYPDYLFHHGKGKVVDDRVVFQMPHFALPQGLTNRRVQDRDAMRKQLESQRRFLDESAQGQQFDRYREAAMSLLLNGKVHDAFDLSRADARLHESYGRHSFGQSLLMAAQLVEAGVSLVQVNLGNNETWDTHQSAFPNLKNYLLPPLDQSLSALLDDLESRGLLRDTLVVMGSEFGRTPRIFKIPGASLPGRDHWGATQSMLFAGGGIQGGQVIGATDKLGAQPIRDPWKPENLAATIYEALGLPRTASWEDQLQRPHYIYQGDPIRGLM